MERLILSGGLTDQMADYLLAIEEFEPIDVLVSQLDRHSINKMIQLMDRGVVKSLFIDSGAYSAYTGQVDAIDVDEYCDYVNSIDDKICLVAQVDTIPGKYGVPKTPQDYIDAPEGSWKNYLYMRKRLKSPEKLIPVFHQQEPFSALKRMLDFRDESYNPGEDTRKKNEKGQVWSEEFGWIWPDRITVIGLSPMNDSSIPSREQFLKECYDYILKSDYPDAKTHIFGLTAFNSIKKFPCFSADSVSHRLRSAYNKLWTRKWGTISLSDRPRTTKTKSNMSFMELADDRTLKEFKDLMTHYGFTLEQIKEENAARVAVDIVESLLSFKGDWAYKPGNLVRSKKLF